MPGARFTPRMPRDAAALDQLRALCEVSSALDASIWRPFFLKPQPRFVTVRGGEYLYRPGLSALRWLASGGST
jgi:hypothetical protein